MNGFEPPDQPIFSQAVAPVLKHFFLYPVLGVLLLLLGCETRMTVEPPHAVKGVLDLGKWNFSADGPVVLAGEWDFFPGQLLDASHADTLGVWQHRMVPDKWQENDAAGVSGQGAGTYRLRIISPVDAPDLALWYKTVSTSFELEVNAEVLASAGHPALDAPSSKPAYRTGVCPLPQKTPATFDLLVRVSNHEYSSGGMWEAFFLGSQRQLAQDKRLADIITFVVFGFIASMSVYSLTIFVFRRKDRFYYSFSLFILAAALRTLVTGEYVVLQVFPDLDFSLLIRLEYLTVYLILSFGILYLYNLFPLELGKWKTRAVIAVGIVFSALVIVLPLPLVTSLATVNYLFSALVIALACFAISRAVVRHKEDAKTMGIGVIILGIGAVADIVKNTYVYSMQDILPYALVLFTCMQAVILARRFIAGIVKVDRLTREKEDLARTSEERMTLAVLKERELLAHELHDSVGQKLGFLNLSAQTLQELLHRNRHEEVDKGLQKIASVAAETHTDIREFLQDVRSTQILSRGFWAPLKDFLDYYQEETHIQVELRLEGSLEESSWSPAQKVQTFKIIQEALSNVRKHAQTTSAVVVFRPQNAGLMVEICDQGRGFDSSVSVAKNHFGIEIMKERAAQAGGNLKVESRAGSGTRVILDFSLPLAQPPQALAGSPSVSARQKQISLLVVDDHELFRTGLCNLLSVGGYNLAGIASNGSQAVEMAKNLNPDVILMDIQTPEMDGLMATRMIRSKPEAPKVIILTAFPQVSAIQEAFHAKAAGFLLKSVQPKELFAAIDRVAAGEVLLTADSADQISRENTHVETQLKADPSLAELTSRQLEVLKWASAGLTYKEIGAKLFISERTVKYHMGEVVEKLNVKDRHQAQRLLKK